MTSARCSPGLRLGLPLLVAALLSAAGAGATAQVDVVWSETGTAAATVPDGTPLTAEIHLTADAAGVSSYGVSLRFDDDLTLAAATPEEPLPSGFQLNLSEGVDGVDPETVLTFEAATLADGPVGTRFLIGIIHFIASDPKADGTDLVPGLFHAGVDGVFDNAGESPATSFAGAEVTVPEPDALLLLIAGVGLLALLRPGGRRARMAYLPLLLALGVLAPPIAPGDTTDPAEVQDDQDADGWVDSVDDCVLHANPDQRDSDGDGPGNACDADYDQTNVTDVTDFALYRAAYGLSQGEAGFLPIFDHTGEGVVGVPDFNVFRSLLGEAPGPAGAGSDGAGVLAGLDLCPGTAPGATEVGLGCALLDLLGRPHELFEPIFAELDGFDAEIAPAPHLESVSRELATSQALLREALGHALHGDPCEAEQVATLAREPLAVALADLSDQQRVAEGAIPVPGPAEDVNESQLLVEEFAYLMARLSAIADRVTDAAMLETQACGNSTQGQAGTGTIRRLDEGNRRIELDDGRVLYFGEGFRVLPAPRSSYAELVSGIGIAFEGTLASEGGFVSEAAPDSVPMPMTDVVLAPCGQVRFAPWQRFPPAAVESSYELLHPDAYLVSGTHHVERGMRIGVAWSCPPPTLPIWARYAYRIELTWTPPGASSPQTDVLAPDFDASDVPLPLPSQLSLGSTATVIATLQKQSCHFTPTFSVSCGPKSDIASSSYPLLMVGPRCIAQYTQTMLAVNDQTPGAFQVTRLDDAISLHISDTPPVFEAEGYAAIPPVLPLASSFPVVVDIVGEQPFAVHATDFWPVHGAPNALTGALVTIGQGVSKAAGLRWPRLRGIRNGHEWSFSCTVPTVIRDVVNFCPGETTDAFYRLPFAAGDTEWSQGQGNNGSFTHTGGFAYDMGAPMDQDIHAARGGRVIWVKEDESQQCGCQACPGPPLCPVNANQIWVRHQDGSFGQYVHPPMNGIVPDENEVVKRGQKLAVVGVTGNTSGPHLHFAEKFMFTLSGSTSLALFEALDPDDESQVLTCYEPPNTESGPGVPLRSNNAVP